MKLIAKHLNLIGLTLLSGFALAAGALYFDIPSRVKAASESADAAYEATCPMHQPARAGSHACGADNGSESSCGTQSHSCCSSPTGSRQLPAGHPPVEGYTVAPSEAPHRSVPE